MVSVHLSDLWIILIQIAIDFTSLNPTFTCRVRLHVVYFYLAFQRPRSHLNYLNISCFIGYAYVFLAQVRSESQLDF